MIRYALRCDHAHRFDSWFGSSADFDRLLEAGLVSCSICGSGSIAKDLMAPSIGATAPEPSLSAPASPAEQALAELRRRIEATSEDVGRNFASEARRDPRGRSPRALDHRRGQRGGSPRPGRGRHPGGPPALVGEPQVQLIPAA